MKYLVLCFVAALSMMVPSELSAQKKPAKAVISIPNAQDEACKDRVEHYLSREYGVLSSNVNYKKHTVTVLWVPDRTNIENIKTSLANLGYDADDVKAEPEAYKRLPKSCQHLKDTPVNK